MSSLVVTVIGGGSSYTPELVAGLIRRHDTLPVTELRLVDIAEGQRKLEVIASFARRMIATAGIPMTVTATLDRRRALEGAGFVVTQLRVGGLAAREKDETLPLRYDLVGQETTGAGGFAKALRTVPVILDICSDIEELCPRARLINFTNPSGLVTEAVLGRSAVSCIGLCNVPITMVRSIAEALHVDSSRLDCRFAGVNHLSFITSARLDGKDVLGDLLASPGIVKEIFKDSPAADIDPSFVRGLGVIPSSYLQYYWCERAIVERDHDRVSSGRGTRAREVMAIEKDLFARYADTSLTAPPPELMKRGGAYYSEVAVSLMGSVWNGTGDTHVVNTRNGDAVPDIPSESVVETSCRVGSDGATPLRHGPLPEGVRGLVQHAKTYERLTIEAAVSGSRETALAALCANPLVREPGIAERLLDDILTAHAPYLVRFTRG
ncbi:MAG TPA: 6-phospho-beta-glucosidase [Spirochaetia bacterium]